MELTIEEPLCRFGNADSALSQLLKSVDELKQLYIDGLKQNQILANTLEAIRVELTYHSNAIEGSTLTLRDTALIVEGREPNTGKSLREIYEARNHDKAIRTVESWVSEQRSTVNEAELLETHGQVLADILPSEAGSYRTGRVLIRGSHFVPPGSHHFPTLMPQLFTLANRRDCHPVIRAAELHYNLVAVHPFADGNGRTARLMMNYLLLQNGYSLTIVPIEWRAEYLIALESTNTGNWQPFATFVARCVEHSLRKILG